MLATNNLLSRYSVAIKNYTVYSGSSQTVRCTFLNLKKVSASWMATSKKKVSALWMEASKNLPAPLLKAGKKVPAPCHFAPASCFQ